MIVVKILKGILRLIADLLYLIVAIIVAGIILSSVGFVFALILTLPVWYGLSVLYKGIFGPRGQKDDPKQVPNAEPAAA